MSNYNDFTGSLIYEGELNDYVFNMKKMGFQDYPSLDAVSSFSIGNSNHIFYFLCCLRINDIKKDQFFTNAKIYIPIECDNCLVEAYLLKTHYKTGLSHTISFTSDALNDLDYQKRPQDIISHQCINSSQLYDLENSYNLKFISFDISQLINEAVQRNENDVWFRLGFRNPGEEYGIYDPKRIEGLSINNLICLEYKIRRNEVISYPYNNILDYNGKLLTNYENFDLMFVPPEVSSNNEFMPITFGFTLKENSNGKLTKIEFNYEFSYEVINEIEIAIINNLGQKTIFTKIGDCLQLEDNDYIYNDIYISKSTGELLYYNITNNLLILRSKELCIQFMFITNDKLLITKIGTDFDDQTIRIINSKLLMEFSYNSSNMLSCIELYGDKGELNSNNEYSGLIERMTVSYELDDNSYYIVLYFEKEQRYSRYEFNTSTGNVLLSAIRESYDSSFDKCFNIYNYDFSNNIKIFDILNNKEILISKSNEQIAISSPKGAIGCITYTKIGNIVNIVTEDEKNINLFVDSKGKLKEIYFPNQEYGYVTLYNKDVNNKIISSEIRVPKFMNNLFPSFDGMYISSLEEINNNYCSNIFGNIIYKITPSTNVLSFTKMFNYNGYSNETFEFSFFFKTFLNNNQFMKIKLCFYKDNNLIKEIERYGAVLYDDYQCIYETVQIFHPIDRIDFTLETNTQNEFYFTNFNFQKCFRKKNNKYNENNEILNESIHGKETRYIYEDNKFVGIKTSAGEDITILGDKFGLQRTISNKTNSEIQKQVENYQTKVISKYNWKDKVNDVFYYYNSNNEVNKINEDEKITFINNDRQTHTKNYITNNLAKHLTKMYHYENDFLKKFKTSVLENNETKDSTIDYNYLITNDQLGSINEIIYNNVKYKMFYDLYNRLNKVEFHSDETHVLEEFTYLDEDNAPTNNILTANNFENIYLNRRLIITKLFDKAVMYQYYDNATNKILKDLIKTSLYGDIITENSNDYIEVIALEDGKFLGVTTRTTYEYDTFGNLINVNIENFENNLINQYSYNYYISDNNTLKSKRLNMPDSVCNIIYEDKLETSKNSLSGILENISYSSLNDYLYPSQHYSFMFGEKLDTDGVNLKFDEQIKTQLFKFTDLNSYITIPLNKINNYRINNSIYNDRTFKKEFFEEEFFTKKTFNIIFRLNSKDIVLSQQYNPYIYLINYYFYSFVFCNLLNLRYNCNSNCLELCCINSEEVVFQIPVSIDQWHCLSLTVDNSVEIILDGYEVFKGLNSIDNIAQFTKYIVLGFEPNGMNESSFAFPDTTCTNNRYSYEVLYVSIGTERIINKNNFNVFSILFSYINNNDYNSKTNTLIYKNREDFKLIPLNGVVDSIIKPVIFNVKNLADVNIANNNFFYDRKYNRMVYCSKLDNQFESLLGYDLNLNNKALLYFRFLPFAFNNDGYIFSIHNKNNSFKWGIVITEKGNLRIVYYDETLNYNLTKTTDLYVQDNCWHDLFVRVNENIIEITLDDNTYVFYNNPFASLYNTHLFIGSSVEYLSDNTNNLINSIFNLNGYFDCFGYEDESIVQLENLEQLRQELTPISALIQYDFNGRVKSKNLHSRSKELVTHYQYYDDLGISKVPTSEVTIDNELIIYNYDDFNNIVAKKITKLDGTLIEQYLYEYDFQNTLIKESKDICIDLNVIRIYDISFTYDEYGNITRKSIIDSQNNVNNIAFSYNNQNKQYQYENVLNQVISDEKVITFDYNSLNGPSNINVTNTADNTTTNNLLQWRNDQLIRYNDIIFDYNEFGQRIKKTNNNEITSYYYEGDLLIRSVKNNTPIDYLYDDNNILLGFIYNNNDYYYVRDITGNINKIVDRNGVVMVKYNYTAYGEVSIEHMLESDHPQFELSNELINHNALLYKGYCYDVETQLFYCNSRYYSPELCRWISHDSIEYLDPSSINGLNLYCYCHNNPIMYYDPSGHIAISTLIVGAIIGLVVGGATSAITQGLDKGWDNINGWQVLLDATIGGISGALGASGINQAVSMIAGGVLGAAGSVAGDIIAVKGDFSQLNIWNVVGKAAIMGAIGIGLGRWTGAGTQNSKAMVKTINAGKSWGSKAILTSAKEVALRPNSGLTLQTMYMNMAKAINGYTIQGISKVSSGILLSTAFGNSIGW